MARITQSVALIRGFALLVGCTQNVQPITSFQPKKLVDLGMLVNAELPKRMWGAAFLRQMGFERPNSFEVMKRDFQTSDKVIHESNGYYTLFNHGGPHVDAPNHVGVGGGLDTYQIEDFAGPVRVFDARGCGNGKTVPVSLFVR
jgi:Putative cyclase